MIPTRPATCFIAATLLAGCAGTADPFAPVPLAWETERPPSGDLPAGVRLERGMSRSLPLIAWAVRVDPSADGVRVGVVRSSDGDGRSTATEMARETDACVLINGGFYWIDDRDRAHHIGLLVRERSVIEEPLGRVVWQQVRYPTARATLGAGQSGPPVIRWVDGHDGGLYVLDRPFDNALGRPALPADTARGVPWDPTWALSAGPALVVDGRPTVTREEEVFFDAHIPRIHPRSAAGVTREGHIVLVVVDGRQPGSRGATLEELAVIMHDLGAEWAMNLDGGGSSTLVVNGELVNRPAGSGHEREIVSALTIHCD